MKTQKTILTALMLVMLLVGMAMPSFAAEVFTSNEGNVIVCQNGYCQMIGNMNPSNDGNSETIIYENIPNSNTSREHGALSNVLRLISCIILSVGNLVGWTIHIDELKRYGFIIDGTGGNIAVGSTIVAFLLYLLSGVI